MRRAAMTVTLLWILLQACALTPGPMGMQGATVIAHHDLNGPQENRREAPAIPSVFSSEPLSLQDLEPLLVEILARPEKELSIEKAAFLIAEALYPEVQMDRYERMLKELAEEIRPRVSAAASAQEKIAVLNHFLFEEKGFRESYALEDPRIRFLPWVLERRTGQCLGLTTLYVALGERLGLPLSTAELPGHIFPRFMDGTTQYNLETLRRGELFTNEQAKRAYGLSEETVLRGIYLRNLGKKEFVSAILAYRSTVLSQERSRPQLALAGFNEAVRLHPQSSMTYNNRGNHFFRARHFERAKADFEKAIESDPYFYEAYCNLASCYYRQSDPQTAVRILEEAVRRAPDRPTAHYNLGIIHDTELGNITKALYHYERYLQVNGEDPQVRRWVLELQGRLVLRPRS